MADQTSSSLRSILYAMRDQLLAFGVCPEKERILFVAEDDPPLYVCTQDIAIQMGKEKAIKPNNVASGRVTFDCIRELTIHVRSSFTGDTTGLDETHLTEISVGHIVFLDAVYNALHDFWPVDLNNNVITIDPIKLGDCSEAKRLPKRPDWIVSKITAMVKYQKV